MEISVGFDRKRKGKTQRQEKTKEIPGSNPTRVAGFDEYKVETIWFSFFCSGIPAHKVTQKFLLCANISTNNSTARQCLLSLCILIG